jgi:guanylate kinase
VTEADTVATGARMAKIFVVSGPSGAGKTSLCKAVLKDLPGIKGSISHTTRPPREGEIDGDDYWFVAPGTFETMIEEGGFLEWAEVHGYRYGTSQRAVEQCQKDMDLLLEVDCKGAAHIKKKIPAAVLVFIMTPSVDDLLKRILRRGPISEEELIRRMDTARDEIQQLSYYDYLVVNGSFSEALQALRSIVLAERWKRGIWVDPWMQKWIGEISCLRNL